MDPDFSIEQVDVNGDVRETAHDAMDALESQGKIEEAEAYVTLTLELADLDDVNSQVLARIVRAKLDARQGRADTAIAAATDALMLADTTADIDFQGDVHGDFGLVLTRLGRMAEARSQYEMALACYERKGDLTSAASIGRLLESMPRTPEAAR